MISPIRPLKLKDWHLDRAAVVYVRQSTPQQVCDHQESTARQYALAGRATSLGWPRERVQVIDDDLGKSGESAEGHPGFQRLLAEIWGPSLGFLVNRRAVGTAVGHYTTGESSSFRKRRHEGYSHSPVTLPIWVGSLPHLRPRHRCGASGLLRQPG